MCRYYALVLTLALCVSIYIFLLTNGIKKVMHVIYMFVLYIYTNIFKNKFSVIFILLHVTLNTNNIILITVIAQRERLTILFQRKRFSGGQLK